MEQSIKKAIALTGGIACGKSQVAKYFRDLGFETIDADDIVHEIIPEDERRRLAKVVFNNPAARKELEARVHPIVKERIESFIASRTKWPPIVVVPLLFEVGWEGLFGKVITVISPVDLQIERMCSTRGYTKDEAEKRIASQMSTEEKAARSDFVIVNDSTIEKLKEKIAFLAEEIRKEFKGE